MFMNDVHKKDEIRDIAIQDLRRIGVKYRRKKVKSNLQEVKKTSRCFKVDIVLLPTQVVTLNDGQQLVVPVVIHELCSFILKKVDTEGLFRKEGSKSRQNEIKISLNAGCKIEEDYHVIDVAGILKTFLRELPEPLIPTSFHEYFLRCTILEKEKLDAILLLSLLLPQEHLNTLAYLLRFFYAVSKRSNHNKMTSMNLAIVLGPNIIPMQQDRSSYTTQHKIKKTCELLQLLIENANQVGIIPEYIIDQVANTASEDVTLVEKKKKRRSGSLTRMFNGLKKIVGNNNNNSNKSYEMSPTIVTPDLLLTPSITRSAKKRRMDTINLSTKKKKDMINKLTDGKILKMPFASTATPISENPNPKTDKRKCVLKEANVEKTSTQVKEKKTQWYTKKKSCKQSSKNEDEENPKGSQLSLGRKSLIERRWSAVSSVANFRKSKKRTSYGGSQTELNANDETIKPAEKIDETYTVEESLTEESFVKIPKAEYERIKNRVSAIEQRLSLELDNVQSKMASTINDTNKEIVKTVQAAYEQALVHSEPMSPTTDQLARRLSRELKIRRSSDHVIRSPSARKIGTLKRRSRESERQNSNNVKLARNQSWHTNEKIILIPRVTTMLSRANSVQCIVETPPKGRDSATTTPSDRILRSSLNKSNFSSSYLNEAGKNSNNSSDRWMSGDRFFSSLKTPSTGGASNGRPSIAEIRSQNAGMVMAKAKLFDKLVDFEPNEKTKKAVKTKTTYKIGGFRQSEVMVSQKIKSLRSEDKKANKKTLLSPRRSRFNLSQRQKLQAAKQLVEGYRCRSKLSDSPGNCEDKSTEKQQQMDKRLVSPVMFTPRKSPVIKKPLLIKSPKRLCKSPYSDRRTPLKVFTPRPMDYC